MKLTGESRSIPNNIPSIHPAACKSYMILRIKKMSLGHKLCREDSKDAIQKNIIKSKFSRESKTSNM
jgi:hypothetical protein